MKFRQFHGLSDIADAYDVFFVDSYGVLHEGVELYPWARHCLLRLKTLGKHVHIITNTPRRTAQVKRELTRLSLQNDLYTDLLSAGETTWRMLSRMPSRELGDRYYFLGPPRSRTLLDGLRFTEVPNLTDAQWLLIVGVDEAVGQIEGYDEILSQAKALGLPAICANPDRVAIRGGTRGPAAGTLADYYRDVFGACVAYYGKPYPDIYALALEMAGNPPRERCLAVGDGLYTDILGGQQAGLDQLLIIGGIHAEPLGFAVQAPESRLTDFAALERLAAAEGAAAPACAVARFSW